MRGINRVLLSGSVTTRIEYGTTGSGSPVCSFTVATSRPGAHSAVVTSFVKINAYSQGLVDVCRARLFAGAYVIVEGELMNRDGRMGELTEVRARDLIFMQQTNVPTTEDT